MTATPALATPTGTDRGGTFTGTWTLVRFLLRRDRARLPAWAIGLGLFIVYLAAALPQVAETEEELRGTTELFHDPVGRMLTGPGYGFDAPTFERFVANGYGLYLLILAALMSILLVVRHTRVEEQTGRAELVLANVVGRHAGLAATLIVVAISNLAVALAVFVSMVGVGGFGAGGSALFAAGLIVTGLAFAGLTTITVQLSEYSRAAAGMAGAMLGAAFVIRAGGDMAEVGGNALSWFSPLAWAQQTAPFVLDRWWPLILPLVFAVLTAAVGVRLASRRDLSASLVAVRPGRPAASASLGTPLGLAWRLQRASVIGWSSSLAVAGVVFGAYADPLLGAMDDLPEVFLELFGAEDLLTGYLAYMAVYMAYFVGAYAILAVQGLRAEEIRGRAGPVLATPVSRWAWLGANLAVTAGAVLAMSVVVGIATGIGVAIVTGDGAHIGELAVAHLTHAPAVLVVLGVAVLLFGLLPRAIPVTWALVGYGLFAGTFGAMLDLPAAALGVSPFEHAAGVPLEPFEVAPVVVLTAIAATTVTVGLLAFRRRDVEVT